MAELADARDLKSLGPKAHTGSSPVPGTICMLPGRLDFRNAAV